MSSTLQTNTWIHHLKRVIFFSEKTFKIFEAEIFEKLDNVLPRVVPGHALAPGPQPEDVQHADVLSAVLRQVL